jgi:hypothetical protein
LVRDVSKEYIDFIRSAGIPKNRWIDGILKDIQVLKVKNWKELTGNKKEWNNLVEKPRTHPEL